MCRCALKESADLMSRSKKRQQEIPASCVYCGQHPATTRDHVVSRGLYLPPYPKNMLTVPSCLASNQEKARSEDSLRDFLAIDLGTSQAPEARALFHSSVARAIQHNRSKVVRTFLKGIRPIATYTPGGVFAGYAYGVDLGDDPITKTLTFMVRGLYFGRLNRQLPNTVNIEIRRAMNTAQQMQDMWDESVIVGYPHFEQGATFRCLYTELSPSPTSSVWLLQFYRRTVFFAMTNPRAVLEQS